MMNVMKRVPKIGERVALPSGRDVWIVDQVFTQTDTVTLRLNGIPAHVQEVPWGALIFLDKD
jgi:hypothetical protein